MHREKAVVIGGGWSGLAAAIELQQSGVQATLIEAAPQLGGRARRVRIDLGFGDITVDNGQHLLIGAYRETLALMRRIGIEPGQVLRRERMQLVRSDGLRLRAAAMPAPWNLIGGLVRATGFSLGERASIVRLMLSLRLGRWRARPGESVLVMLKRLHQPEALIRRLWAPLCVAALNTPAERASAQVFACVLRDSLGAQSDACDFLLPRADLSACLPDPAARWLQQNGAHIRMSCTVRHLHRRDTGWTLATDHGPIDATKLLIALTPRGALRLLQPILPADHALPSALSAERFEAIRTAYVAWPETALNTLPDWIMLDEHDSKYPGQWLFDRGIHSGHRVAAIVVSAANRDVSPEQICDQVCDQLNLQLHVPRPSFARVITERHATFQAICDRPLGSWRPGIAHAALADQGIWLAGDYLDPDYPATLESAVRGGLAAARALRAAASDGGLGSIRSASG